MTIDDILSSLLEAYRYASPHQKPLHTLNLIDKACAWMYIQECNRQPDLWKFWHRCRHNLESAKQFIRIDANVVQSAILFVYTEIRTVKQRLEMCETKKRA